jgi:hypothetical protein
MRGVHLTPNILKRVHEGRLAIFLAGHPMVPSPSVASPAPTAPFYPLNNKSFWSASFYDFSSYRARDCHFGQIASNR